MENYTKNLIINILDDIRKLYFNKYINKNNNNMMNEVKNIFATYNKNIYPNDGYIIYVLMEKDEEQYNSLKSDLFNIKLSGIKSKNIDIIENLNKILSKY